MTTIKMTRNRLLATAGIIIIASTSASVGNAQIVSNSGESIIGITQSGTGFTIGASVLESTGGFDITSGDVTNSTVTLGTSSLSRNVTSASGTGNDATLSVTSSVNADTAVAANQQSTASALTATSTVLAEVAIGLSQSNTTVVATVSNDIDMTITSTAVTGSTIQASSNIQEAFGQLNNARNTITTAVNSTDATSAIASLQANSASTLTVSTTGVINLDLDATGTSLVELSGNTQRAVAVGSTGTNTQTLTGNNVTLAANDGGNATAGTGAVTVGGYITSSAQTLAADSNVSASIGDPTLVTGLDAFGTLVTGTLTASTLSTDSNTGVALARGNEVTNATSFTANSLTTAGTGTTATGIASLQTADASTVTATAYNGTGAMANTEITSTVKDSTVSTSRNATTAFAGSNSGINTQAIDVSNITLATTGGAATVGATAAGTGSFVTASTQSLTGASNVSATVGTADGFNTIVGGALETSTLRTDSNTGTAVARGNEVLNSTTLTGNSITAVAGNVAAIGSLQTAAGSDVTADSFAAGGLAETKITGAVTSSTVSTSQNIATAEASANRGSNALTANVTDLKDGVAYLGTATAASGAVSTASFAVASSQTTDGESDVTARIGSGGGPTVLTSVNDAAGVTGSTIESDGNQLRATATGNLIVSGTNSITLTGSAIDASTALTNFQSGAGDVTSSIGGTTTAAGVTVAIGGTGASKIDASTVSVDGNIAAGAATGNSAVNRITVASSELAQGTALTTATATQTTDVASADNALSSSQSLDGTTAAIASTVNAKFDITTLGVDNADAITGSSLSVSSNAQSAFANGNTVTNAIALSGNSVTTSGALLSEQTVAAASLTASSTMTAQADAAITGSTLALNDNSNRSSAALNTATNNLSATASSLASVSTGADADLKTTGGVAPVVSGDLVLNNFQAATTAGAIASTATTTVGNNDGGDKDQILNSTVRASRNVTIAEGMSNVATNTATLSATTGLSATGGVLNTQANAATVDSTAISTVGFAVGAATNG
ncbi:beta strand repeat-containing protein, partial [Sandarakinorhabdus sp.]|uniref:beta strand repeat-containing protein n=1 Tax=Sandarakinorhabdus sp. TaxID=1916663 RepID=UPI003F6F5CBD